MTEREGYIDVPGGRVWYRSVGEGGVPMLALHGGPGFPHDYLEALTELTDERQVVFYDQLGCGRSDQPEDESLWVVERFVEEVGAVQEALGLERPHLFGNSWGGMLALEYALGSQDRLASVIVSNSPGNMTWYERQMMELRRALPPELQETMDWHEERGFTDCPEYQGAMAEWARRHICRLRPWPEALERAFAGFGLPVYHTMMGPSEFHVTGNLREWDILERLDGIRLPTLFISGEHDEIRPEQLAEMHRRVPGSELHHYDGCSHTPFEEDRERFFQRLRAFLSDVEGKETTSHPTSTTA